jgi:hypothetical protein
MESKTNDMTQHWVVVVDAQGRERLEARWHDAGAALEISHAA